MTAFEAPRRSGYSRCLRSCHRWSRQYASFSRKISLHTNNLAVPVACQGKASTLRRMISRPLIMLEKRACLMNFVPAGAGPHDQSPITCLVADHGLHRARHREYTMVATAGCKNLNTGARCCAGRQRHRQSRCAGDIGKAGFRYQDRENRLILAVQPHAPHADGWRRDRQCGSDHRVDVRRRSPRRLCGSRPSVRRPARKFRALWFASPRARAARFPDTDRDASPSPDRSRWLRRAP